MPGVFITIEGGEGAGKSTQQQGLAAWLEGLGLPVLRTREPGGTPGAEAIRGLVLGGVPDAWSVGGEALLMTTARLDHVERIIAPALARGEWVVCDRFLDSTRVYQGIAGGLGVARIDALHDLFMRHCRPDLTLLLDLPVAEGLARRQAAGGGSRFEAKGTAYHEKVRQGFLDRARAEPDRFAVIDAARPPQTIARTIAAELQARLGERLPDAGKGRR